MLRINDKWTLLLLALLLGTAPFARGFAESIPAAHHLTGAMHDTGHHHAVEANMCDDCSDSLSCHQCGACSVTIVLAPPAFSHTPLNPLIPSGESGSPSNHPFLLFRPPRV
ncbi:MAG: hypothetical protein R6X15_06450 [Pseudomonadota bacterium]